MKEEFSIVLLFSRGSSFVHECSANFRSRFGHFDSFSSKLPEIASFSLKIVIVLSFSILLYLSGSKFCPRVNFRFSANFGRFHEYTLNMTSYHVIEVILELKFEVLT